MDLDKLKTTIESVLKIDLYSKVRCLDYVDGRIIFCLIAMVGDADLRNKHLSEALKKHHTTITHYRKHAFSLVKYNKGFSEKYRLCVEAFFSGDVSRFFNEENIKKATLINKYTV